MKVKLAVHRGGTGFQQERGQIVEVADDEGRRMIAAEQGTQVIDTASCAPPEAAVKRHGRPRRNS
jgi:hypothetical protein